MEEDVAAPMPLPVTVPVDAAPGADCSPAAEIQVAGALNGLCQGQERLELELRAVHKSLRELQDFLRLPETKLGAAQERPPERHKSKSSPESEAETRSVDGAVGERLSLASLPMGRSGPDLSAPLAPPPSLPPCWPACLEARQDAAQACVQTRSRREEPGVDLGRVTRDRLHAWSRLTADHEEDGKNCLVWDPNSSQSVAWSALTLLVLAHDAFAVPWTLAWDARVSGFALALTLVSCAFWTFDLLLAFFMGYHHRHGIEMRLRFTVKHHLKTWFLPDLCMVVVDWLSIVPLLTPASLLPSKNIGSLLRIAKAGKVARILGLMRMMKLAKYIEDYVESGLFSDASRLVLRLMQFLAAVVWMTHIMTCIWYRIGRLRSDTGMNWVHTTFSQETPWGRMEVGYLELGLWHQYLTAFHWAIAQVSLGSTEILCYNSAERCFTCVCILLSFLGGSTLVSSLSATMVDYQAVHRQRKEMLTKLRRFLRENRGKVSKGTALLVQQQATERLRLADRIQEHEVHVLDFVSAKVRKELRFEIFQGMLMGHGLLQLWALLDKQTLQRVCFEALEYKHYQPLDEIFAAGAATDRCYHLDRGRLVYSKEPETAPVHFREALSVPSGAWLAEAALWSQWLHVGTATAEAACELLHVPAEAVAMMMQQQPEVHRVTAQYAARYLQQVRAARPPEKAFPDDLTVPETHFEELVTSLQPSLQINLSLRVINQRGATLHKSLRQDISSGGCCVVMQPDGTIERATCWVVLKLQDSRRQLLVQLASRPCQQQRWLPCCDLVKSQVQQGELGREALERLLQNFGLDQSDFVQTGMERRLEHRHSPEFGVPTRMVQREHQLLLKESASLALRRQVVSHRRSFHCSESTVSARTTEHLHLTEHITEVLLDDSSTAVFAWLTPGIFEYLQTPSGERDLGRWLVAIEPFDVLGAQNTQPEDAATLLLDCAVAHERQPPLWHKAHEGSGDNGGLLAL